MEKQILQNQIALFNLVCALSEKLTGQVPSVKIQQEDGSASIVCPAVSAVTWYQADSQEPCRLVREMSKHHSPVSF